MRFEVEIIKESGYEEALLGLAQNKNQLPEHMHKVALKLAGKGGGHDKFLRQIAVWLRIKAARYWWAEFDTYKIGTTAQSQSTMHTITHRDLTQDDFAYDIPEDYLTVINKTLEYTRNGMYKIQILKNILPEGFLQQRVISCNYAVLLNIMRQRINHRLPEWKEFVREIQTQCEFPAFLPVGNAKK